MGHVFLFVTSSQSSHTFSVYVTVSLWKADDYWTTRYEVPPLKGKLVRVIMFLFIVGCVYIRSFSLRLLVAQGIIAKVVFE